MEWGSPNRGSCKPLDSKPRFSRGFVLYGEKRVTSNRSTGVTSRIPPTIPAVVTSKTGYRKGLKHEKDT